MTRRFFTAKPMTQAAPGGSLDMGLRLSAFVAPAEPVEPAAPVICPECPECPPAGGCVEVPFLPWTINGGARLYHDEDGCLIQSSSYGHLDFTPRGTWLDGFRPPTLTVNGQFDDYLVAIVGSYISVLDGLGNEIGRQECYGVAPPYVIPLSFVGTTPDHDIAIITIMGIDSTPFALCEMTLNCPA